MQHQKIMIKSFLVNIFLVVLKIVSGIIFGSVALIADGIHSISDLLSDIFVILGIRHSLKPADDDHPFGHGKFEYVLSLLLGISIVIVAYNLGKEVIEGFNNLTTVPNVLSLVVILFVVVIKLILAKYLINKGLETDSEIISASGKESLSDVISSAVVFVGVISVLIGDYFNVSFLTKGDKIASIIIALFIIRIGIVIILDAVHSLQGKTVKEEICAGYKEDIRKVKGVIDVDKLDMISYGPYYQAIVEIKTLGDITVKEGHDIATEVHEKLMESEKICHVSVHVNPEE
jgi:cation diffusion facilitator family transporter